MILRCDSVPLYLPVHSINALALFGDIHRGVRLVASAHGDLHSLLKNPNLNTILGGTKSVTISDAVAKENGGNKVRQMKTIGHGIMYTCFVCTLLVLLFCFTCIFSSCAGCVSCVYSRSL